MKVMLFDTETTGLPKTRNLAIKGRDNWPHIVSISWVILDADTNTILKKASYIVRPNGWVIPQDSIDIHRITNEYANINGVPLSDAIYAFANEDPDILVAHNAEFDFNVLVNALKWDLGIDPIVLDKPVFCSMKLSKNICRIPSKYGFKSPKLSELYQFVMKKSPISNSLHGSLYDAEILTEIIQNCNELREQMGLPVTNVTKLSNGNQKVPSKTLSIKLT